MRCQKGFTLVEILFVLIIIAVVMAYAVPSYKRTKDRAAYDAATGILVDLGNAVQAMKRDLTMQGYSFTTYPFPASDYHKVVNGDETLDSSTVENSTLKNFLSISNATTRDTRFVGSLFAFGYMEPFTSNNYNYYVIRSTSANVCNTKCRVSGVVACMCKSSLNNLDCYYGAAFLNTGGVKRLEGNSCGS